MLPHQFKRLMELLRGQLGAVHEAINKQTDAAIDEQTANREEVRSVAGRLGEISNAVKATDEEANSNYEKTYRQQERLITSQKWLVRWAALTFFAAFGYGSVALWQGCLMRQQIRIAQSAANTAANELELSERPWIAVEQLRLTKEPYWEIFRGPKFFPPTKETITVTNLHAPFTFSVVNVGKSPAINVFSSVQIAPVEIGRNFHKPQLGMQMACSAAEAESREASKPSAINEGSAIFPGAPLSQPWEPIYAVSQPNQRIDQVWIAVCIIYRAGFSPRTYHTKFWFESVPKFNSSTPSPIGSGQSVTWIPFDSFVLYDSEAD
jgi:hypothetical protein